MDLSGAEFKRTPGRKDSSTWLSRVNDIATTVVSTRTYLFVMLRLILVSLLKWRWTMGLFILLWYFYYASYSWLIYFVLLIILYLKVSLSSILSEPVYCVDYHWLLDSPTTFPPLARQNSNWCSIFYVLFSRTWKYELFTSQLVYPHFCVLLVIPWP